MEVSRSTYSTEFGAERVASVTVVDIDRENMQATLLCDLCEPGALPEAAFDCVILAQTLQYLRDLGIALSNLWRSLAPQGVLLITVPALSRDDPLGNDFWRFTPAGLGELLAAHLPAHAEIAVTGYGNALTGAAALLGLTVEDVGPKYFGQSDPSFPLLVAARVVKVDGNE
jgi:SAM-dependent methyltransferase